MRTGIERSSTHGGLPEGISLEECTAEHRAEQAELFNACFTKDLDKRDISWRYDQNPYGVSLSLLAQICFP